MQDTSMASSTFPAVPGAHSSQDLAAVSRKYSRQRTLLAFFIPIVVMFFAFGIQGVFPFGNHHILTVDLFHQYAPFLSDFRQKLLSGDSWFFTWSGGLGVNFYALYAYYLASPLNFLALIFPDQLLSELVLVLVLLKIGLAGASFHFFLRDYYHRDGPLCLGFAVAYALSGYTMAYFFNIMWLDTLYCLPLLAWSMTKLIRKQVYTPYVLILALTLISNFYTGFFACFFCFFFFFVLLSRENLASGKDKFLTFARVAIATIFGLALSAITLYPTLKAMGLTSAVGDSFPTDYSMKFADLDFLSRLIPLSSVSVRNGMANIFCGSFVLILLLALAKSRSMKWQQKATSFTLLIFLFASLNNNVLNFIWHGLHFPNQLPYRNSFVLVFYLLFLAYDALPRLREFSSEFMLKVTGLYTLLYLLLLKIDERSFAQLSVYVGIALLLLYGLLFARFTRRPKRTEQAARPRSPLAHRKHLQTVSYLLLALMLFELTLNAFVSIDKFENAEYFGVREGYSQGEEVAKLRSAIAKFQKADPNQLVRMEIKPDKCVNDAMLYRSNGVTIFSSTVPHNPVKYMSKLGYANNGINSYQYSGGTPVLDSLLGLRYIVHRDGNQIQDGIYNKVFEDGPIQVWENTQALPVAFLADASKLELTQVLGQEAPEDTNLAVGNTSAFQYQSRMFSDLSGQDSQPLFIPLTFDDNTFSVDGLSATNQNGSIHITRNGIYNSTFTQPFTVEEAGYYYMDWNLSGLSLREINLIELDKSIKRVGHKSQGFGELGYLEEGTELKLQFDLASSDSLDGSGDLNFHVVRLDKEVYDQGMDALHQRKSELVAYTSNSLRVQTQDPDPGILFVSTTDNPGWKARLDGQEVPIYVLYDAFLGVAVPAGAHELELTFTPPGFDTGAILSGIALVFTLGLAVLDILAVKRRKSPAQAPSTAPRHRAEPQPDPSLEAGWPRHFTLQTQVPQMGRPEETGQETSPADHRSSQGTSEQNSDTQQLEDSKAKDDSAND